ncbi:putative ubiquitin fusion degradation protein C12B10.01c [Pseudocercospora fuligena]|uniref:HECT-type E3 ubiquitin transferase n=1 Tax=Pseudocercospora fuligena TaxID=685502 RepID=A0A8H6REW9_9PEZI|nr:putative ubiquitin fusion degradation protein C12B10.01c [Pseudocercospora fuligena]
MPPSQRITRSATARQNANPDTNTADPANTAAAQQSPATTATGSPPIRDTSAPRKRKLANTDNSPPTAREPRKTKRSRGNDTADHSFPASAEAESGQAAAAPKRSKRAATAAMSSAGSAPLSQPHVRARADMDRPTSGSSAETSPQQIPRDSSRRKSSRRKSKEGEVDLSGGRRAATDPTTDPLVSSSAAPSRKSRKSSRKEHGQDVVMKDVDEKKEQPDQDPNEDDESRQDAGLGADGSDDAAPPQRGFGQDELDAMDRGEDPFATGYLSRFGGHAGLSSSLRALSGIVSGQNSRLRGLLEQLRAKDDPSLQLIALQELSEILLVSNEDNLAGHFAPDQYVKELVSLMQPNEFTGEENPEVMLLACRCIANMMEALPAATASVVYGGAVPVLCQKLLEINFIDVAEQALSTLEKISIEFPSSIVREGGLTACLTYLDFFATSTQRTAVTTAANCCRNIPEESFPTVRDVMPILLNTLSSSDQRVVEQASLCVSRVIDSFKYHDSKLEELVSPELLKAVLRLLLPGTTNMIGPNIHTQFLRVLSITARASPRLSAELLKMNVVDTLYQILTGVSPPTGTDEIAAKIDKNVIMQAIIRTPREQIFETLNVICELLPTVSQGSLMFLDDLQDAGYTGPDNASMSTRSKTAPNDKRVELLKQCPDEVKRFAIILFPTLMHAYTSTVNLSVRQKVLTAQLKMLSNLEVDILEEALRGVTYASHLASILSQQDNTSLVTFALQAAELLLKRLESLYRPQFYREGVMAEIKKLADRPLKTLDAPDVSEKHPPLEAAAAVPEQGHDDHEENHDEEDEPIEVDMEDGGSENDDHDEPREAENDEEDNDEREKPRQDHVEDEEDEEDEDDADNDQERSIDSDLAAPRPARHILDLQDVTTLRAKRFLETHGEAASEQMQSQATEVLDDIKALADQLKACYAGVAAGSGTEIFTRLAKYFDGDAIQSITSYELMTSGIVDVLLDLFTADNEEAATSARSDFLEVFMATQQAKVITGDAKSPSTAFSVLTHKLQELLSRAEHFEVITVHHNAFESNRGSAASMLAKQLRLKLVADDDSGIPRPYRNIMVSIHAIATFKALDDYLRPRISMGDRPRGSRRGDMSSAMAAYAAAMAGRGDRSIPPPPTLPTLGGSTLPTRSSGKKMPRTKSSKSAPETGTEPGKTDDGTSKLRRSSRRHSSQASSSIPPPPPPQPENSDEASLGDRDALQEALECADEAHISDDDDDIDANLDALVDDLEDGALERDEPDPSAVNLEVANSGKVTARTEDGARVSTPSQGIPTPTSTADRMSASARLAAAREMLSTPTSSTRPMSYASAVQKTPEDWHIEFSVNKQPIASDTTIYRACHFNQAHGDEVSARNIWSATHTISFKKVAGPPPSDRSSTTPPPAPDATFPTGLPPSLDNHPVTSAILRLMSILHDLNANLDDVLAEHKATVKLNAEPPSQFVNTKLTAKLNRQLEEPLIVASQCLPTWAEDLARLYPFLFPFETRHLFLQSTSFGYSRLMSRWQNGQEESSRSRHRDERPFLGRVQRQKVRISRSRMLESAMKVMELYGSSSSMLEVEYFDEVGTGLGPTLEFYSTVSKEFSKKKTKLWRENESFDNSEYAFGKRGLFPAPMSEEMARKENGQKVLNMFKMLGKFVARSMLDSRIIDVSFNPTFFRVGESTTTVTPSLGAVAAVDEGLAHSLKVLKKYANAKQRIDEDATLSPDQKSSKAEQIRINDALIEDLGLDFTLPGHPHIELLPHGSTINVTIDNVGQYIKKVIDFTLQSGVQRQVEAFQTGFSLVFPYSALRAFTPDELCMLFGHGEEDWSLETLMDSIKADHGFNLDSRSVRNLLQAMSEFSSQDRRDFLQFVTGSPKLPIGGFKSLTPMFTVVRKSADAPYTSDDYLPSVMTCVNYLKMPDYSSLEVLKSRFNTASKEGQGAFHLS